MIVNLLKDEYVLAKISKVPLNYWFEETGYLWQEEDFEKWQKVLNITALIRLLLTLQEKQFLVLEQVEVLNLLLIYLTDLLQLRV